jgi:hypothetical protein
MPSPPYALENPDAFACVMAAMSAGTEGSYELNVKGTDNPGQYTTTTIIHVLADRAALAESRSQHDYSYIQHAWGPTQLQDPSYFDGCATSADPFGCWQGALQHGSDCR